MKKKIISAAIILCLLCAIASPVLAVISSSTNKHVYNGNGVTRDWDYTFTISTTDGSDIKLFKTNSTGVISNITGSYAVNTTGQYVTYPTVLSGLSLLATGEKITLLREASLDQQSHWRNQGPFNAATVEAAVDKLTMIAQQLDEELSRSIKYPIDQTPNATEMSNFIIAIENLGDVEDSIADAAAAQAAAEAAQAAAASSVVSASAYANNSSSYADSSYAYANNSSASAASAAAHAANATTAVAAAIQATYPIGSIYMSTISTNPATILGFGTWEAFGAGRTLVGINASDTDFNASEKIGGEKTHTLTVDEMPSHNHTLGVSGGVTSPDTTAPRAQMTGTTITSNTGGGQAHNNLQPYIVIYIWKRTA